MYQLIVPILVVACNVILAESQFDAGVVDVIEGIVIVELVEICNIGSPGVPPYSTIYPFG